MYIAKNSVSLSHRPMKGYILKFSSAFQEYAILPDAEGVRVLKNDFNLPWSAYVGVAGMAGMCSNGVPRHVAHIMCRSNGMVWLEGVRST